MHLVDPRAVLAAQNNADLYQLVFSAHKLKYSIAPHAFIGIDPPPPYYSNLTTLSNTQTEEQLSYIHRLRENSPNKISLKDGFSLLDLDSEGFRKLFDAMWVWLDPATLPNASCTEWIRIQSADELSEWEKAWKVCGSPTEHRMFPESLLTSKTIAFFGQRTERGIEAGCIANLSNDSVGLSNVFTLHDIEPTMTACVQLAALFGRGKPVVGYDRGPELKSMIDIGFETVGSLRVWIADAN